MPTYTASVDIPAPPDIVFAYVADLTRHSEWAADPLTITACEPGPITVGSRYQSLAHVRGRPIPAELRVTDYQPPARFAFVAADLTGTYTHQFTFQPLATGTRVERQIRAQLSPLQHLLFLLVYRLRKRPNTIAAMTRLHDHFAQASG